MEVTIFYCHYIYEGCFVEGRHETLPDNLNIWWKMANEKSLTSIECYNGWYKGVIVIPENDKAYYDKKSSYVNPEYWFAGSGDYQNPLESFDYVDSTGCITDMPPKLIALLEESYDNPKKNTDYEEDDYHNKPEEHEEEDREIMIEL